MKKKTKHMLVYKYEYWDEATNRMQISDAYATFDAIMKGLGVPLLDTAMVAPHTGIFRELIGTRPERQSEPASEGEPARK